MNKQKYFIIFLFLSIGLCFSVCQYLESLKTEFASAVSNVPNPGHPWSAIECNSDSLCVDTVNNRLGIGTASPVYKLDVVGDIHATGDVCNSNGACLSQLNEFIGSTALVNSAHTYKACTDAGGSVVSTDVSFKQCKFSLSACPNGWTRYKSYGTTAGTTCTGNTQSNCCNVGCCATSCTISARSFSNSGDTCSYNSCDGGTYNTCGSTVAHTCSTTLTEVGCY